MKISHSFPRAPRRGFTLVEMLVVIAIIGILAAMLLPALAKVKTKAKVGRAKQEIAQIVAAINNYESDYSRFPATTAAMNAAAAAGSDYTFGGDFLNSAFGVPFGASANASYHTSNAEVVSILMDMETFPNGAATPNLGHAKNPQKKKYLSANIVGDSISPGVGQDGVYRDPWGNPYIITIDLNADDKARDMFYSSAAVSSTSPNGLINTGTYYELSSPVMVWSLGPDKQLSASPANQGANKDNILSWVQ